MPPDDSTFLGSGREPFETFAVSICRWEFFSALRTATMRSDVWRRTQSIRSLIP